MRFLKKLIDSGIWVQPIVLIVIIKWLQKNNPRYLDDPTNYPTLLLLSFFPVLIIWAGSIGKPRKEMAITGREAARYPPVPKPLLHKDPTGTVVLGKDKHTGRYVGKKLGEPGHIFLIGGSGSGKSSCVAIPTLMAATAIPTTSSANPNLRLVALDIKGELHSKSTKIGDENVIVFDPQDRSTYGYDPLYLLNENSTSQEIMETMQTIAFSLIPLPGDIKDPFWKQNARNLLIGLLIFYYKYENLYDLVSIIDRILGRPIKESIDEVMEKARTTSPEYHCIVQFKGMDESNVTLSGIVSEMNVHLTVFVNDADIRYAFKNNPVKINPLAIETEPLQIYISIREEKLSQYYDCLQLILNQFLGQFEKRAENSEPVLFLIDELPRILSAGKIDKLLDSARTLRSRNVTLFLVTQSTEALMTAYSENEVADLISNCSYIICLGASSTKTQKAICDWSGQFLAKKTSWSGEGKSRKANISYDEQNIVKPEDLMTLQLTGDAILISPYGYSRIKKTPYYKDKYFKPIAEEIRKNNETVVG